MFVESTGLAVYNLMRFLYLSQRALYHIRQTHLLTCARCLWYALRRPDLPQLESGLYFMTAVRLCVDDNQSKYNDRQSPDRAATVYAWAYSSGHCRISHQVSLWIADCNGTVN